MTLFDYWEEATSNHRVGAGGGVGGGGSYAVAPKKSSSTTTYTTNNTSTTTKTTKRHPWPQPQTKKIIAARRGGGGGGENDHHNSENLNPVVASAKSKVPPLATIRRGLSVSKGLGNSSRSNNLTTTTTATTSSFKSVTTTVSTPVPPPPAVVAVVAPVPVAPAVSNDVPLADAAAAKPVITPTPTTNTIISNTAMTTTSTVGPSPISEIAAYLVYEPDSSGRLVEHYLVGGATPVTNAIGRWTAGANKKIATFKLKRNAGRNVLQGNCSAGVQGRRNYCAGWCQFVKSAYGQGSDDVTLWSPTGKGLKVDVYLYYDDDNQDHKDHPQTVRLLEGVPTTTRNLLAVAAVPKNTPFYERHVRIGLHKWLQDGSTYGYSSKIC